MEILLVILFLIFIAKVGTSDNQDTKRYKYTPPKGQPKHVAPEPLVQQEDEYIYEPIHLFAKGYRAYLRSPEWNRVRKTVLQRDNYQCTACGSKVTLHVHHKTYKNVYFEEENFFLDLTTLCANCHASIDHAPILFTWPASQN